MEFTERTEGREGELGIRSEPEMSSDEDEDMEGLF